MKTLWKPVVVASTTCVCIFLLITTTTTSQPAIPSRNVTMVEISEGEIMHGRGWKQARVVVFHVCSSTTLSKFIKCVLTHVWRYFWFVTYIPAVQPYVTTQRVRKTTTWKVMEESAWSNLRTNRWDGYVGRRVFWSEVCRRRRHHHRHPGMLQVIYANALVCPHVICTREGGARTLDTEWSDDTSCGKRGALMPDGRPWSRVSFDSRKRWGKKLLTMITIICYSLKEAPLSGWVRFENKVEKRQTERVRGMKKKWMCGSYKYIQEEKF